MQTSSLYGGVNGVGTTIDLRGFGITGPSNTLVLINGRRLNDWDLPGFDLSTIARDSIERIEITRGNSGAVLYGDGAVGGVINIVTRNGADLPNQAQVEGGFGSFQTREGNVSASGSSGRLLRLRQRQRHSSPTAIALTMSCSRTSAVGDFRWTFDSGQRLLQHRRRRPRAALARAAQHRPHSLASISSTTTDAVQAIRSTIPTSRACAARLASRTCWRATLS